MKLKYYPYPLELKHQFTISGYSRTQTPGVQIEIEHDGIIGYGEASMPQYLGESIESVTSFLKKVNLSQFDDPFILKDIMEYVDNIAPGNCAAKASIDIALHDLIGKTLKVPCYKLFGLNARKTPFTTYTIGIDTKEMLRKKINEVDGKFKLLKIKLGTSDDKEIIQTIREITSLPLAVDANQGWKDVNEAIEMTYWLKEQGVIMVEQPMPKENLDDIAKVTEKSPIPIYADESIQRAKDIEKVKGAFDGINIKLMKCTGLREAWQMINTAKSLGMKVMIGCMTETSCAVSAAAQLSPAVDFADLDGNLLIKNDLFEGAKIINGKIELNDMPGIGVKHL